MGEVPREGGKERGEEEDETEEATEPIECYLSPSPFLTISLLHYARMRAYID